MPAYKTIVLELIQDQYPTLHERLRASRTLLSTLERYAADLKDRHEHWTAELERQHPTPGGQPSRIVAEALELALEEMRAGLPSESPPSGPEAEPLSLDAAMAYLRRHTPPA